MQFLARDHSYPDCGAIGCATGDVTVTHALHVGGLVRVEAWLGTWARVVGEYETTTPPGKFTDINMRGQQSLRLILEAVF